MLPRPKKVTDDVSCNGICKFEFCTVKNHYSDIHNDILDKHQKSPKKGYFLALKVPRGREPEFCQGQQYRFYVHINYLHIFGKFQKNLMEGLKVMEAKVSFLAISGLF